MVPPLVCSSKWGFLAMSYCSHLCAVSWPSCFSSASCPLYNVNADKKAMLLALEGSDLQLVHRDKDIGFLRLGHAAGEGQLCATSGLIIITEKQ